MKELEDEKKALDELKDQLENFEDDAMSSASYQAKHNRSKAEQKKSIEDQIDKKKLTIERWESTYADRKKELEDLEEMVSKLEE